MSQIQMACPTCQTSLDPAIRVCWRCGHSAGERLETAEAVAQYAQVLRYFMGDGVLKASDAEALEQLRAELGVSLATHASLMQQSRSVAEAQGLRLGSEAPTSTPVQGVTMSRPALPAEVAAAHIVPGNQAGGYLAREALASPLDARPQAGQVPGVGERGARADGAKRVPAGYVLIPAGRYLQGGREPDNRPRQVRISRSFFMKQTPVTQGEWEAVMGSNPSHFLGRADCPVETVSWGDVVRYCNRLSELEGLDKCYGPQGEFLGLGKSGYRLPTEAEWEYAARAGTRGDYCGELDAIAWYAGNSGLKTQPVRGREPNAWGLHDTLGNVSEWTNDWYAPDYGGDATDPLGPATGTERVRRGGSWNNRADLLVVSMRLGESPDYRFGNLGFRMVKAIL